MKSLFHSLFLFFILFLEGNKLDDKDRGFFERKKLEIMQNLDISLRNFHVSYETQSTAKLGHPFSFGITIGFIRFTVMDFIF